MTGHTPWREIKHKRADGLIDRGSFVKYTRWWYRAWHYLTDRQHHAR